MKHKYIHKILFLIVFCINTQITFSQISTDLMKYWFYRNRLKYFVVPGSKIGESQIVCVRNKIIESDQGYIDPGRENIDFGQHGKHNGLYIGVLATEYYLLEQNGQTADAAKTLSELNYALDAVITYWDSLAEPYWKHNNGSPYDGKYNGFFIRGNVPCDFLDTANLS